MRLLAASLLVLVLAGCRGPAPKAAPPAASESALTESWKALALLPSPLITKAVAVLDGTIYFFSGLYGDGPTNDATAYDPAARRWIELEPMPQSLYNQDAVALDGRIYMAGGCVRSDCASPSRAAYSYDPKEDFWTLLPPLPESVFDAAGAAINGRFVVIGGVSNRAASERVYSYSPQARKWARLADLPSPRSHAAGSVFGGRFYLTGGCKGEVEGRYCDEISEEVFIYDPKADAWSVGPSLPMPLHGHGAAVEGRRLVVAGGVCGSSRVDDCGSFTLEHGAEGWVRGPGLIRARFGARLFPLARGVGLFGPNATNNPDDLIEALGWQGPFIDPGEQPYPAAARIAPSRRRKAVRASPPATAEQRRQAAPFDAGDPENMPASVAPRPRAHAVVIGVERYRRNLPPAAFASADAKLTAEYFRRVLGVPEENLALLGNDLATKSDFEKYFERWLPNRVEKGDEVFVYFSGHGAPDSKTGEAYLVPFDADPAYIEQTGYALKRLYAHLAKLPAKRVVVVLDSCFSGAGDRSVIAEGARPLLNVVQSGVPRGLVVMSSSAGNQISNSYREKRHGLFTYFFLKGLKEKRGDLRAAFDYLKPQVSRIARRQYNADQEPQWRAGD